MPRRLEGTTMQLAQLTFREGLWLSHWRLRGGCSCGSGTRMEDHQASLLYRDDLEIVPAGSA